MDLSPAVPPSPHRAAAAQLVAIHTQLRLTLSNVLGHALAGDAAPASLAEYTTLFSRFLLAHHHVEDTQLFPALRRQGRLRSADVAFLAGLDLDHVQVHTLCEGLVSLCATGAPDRAELARQAGDLQHLLLPHLAAEESGLSAERLPSLISADALQEMLRQAQGQGGAQRQQVLELFEHPLHPREGARVRL